MVQVHRVYGAGKERLDPLGNVAQDNLEFFEYLPSPSIMRRLVLWLVVFPIDPYPPNVWCA